jgi:histidine ammonia-lyase
MAYPYFYIVSWQALADRNVEPIPLKFKEHFGILDGTALLASVAAVSLDYESIY